MAADISLRVDVNAAEKEELTQLPGVGEAMAERIIAARPYNAPEDLLQVSGIGPALVERLIPHLDFPAEEAVEAVDLEEADLAVDDELIDENGTHPIPDLDFADIPQPDPGPEVEAPAETIPALSRTAIPKVKVGGVSRGQVMWIAFGSSLLSFLLAVVVILTVLAGINQGLRYVSPADFANLDRQVDGLTTEVDTLQQDLQDLRTRLDAVEALSGRVNTLETQVADLWEDLDTAASQVDAVQTDVDELSADVEEVHAAAGRFDTFLQGLTDLLLETTEIPGGTDGE
jgi:outer membrane murein-binding lipoprotein Lpp